MILTAVSGMMRWRAGWRRWLVRIRLRVLDDRPPLLSILPPRETWRPALQLVPIDVERAEVVIGGERRRLMPQQQAVLSVLLVRELGTHDQLISAVWGAWLEPPASMSSALRMLLTGVRRGLAGTGVEVVTLPGRGWQLVMAGNDDREVREDG